MDIKTYLVVPVTGTEDAMDLVNELDEMERYTALPEDFVPGQRVCEHEFVVKRHTCVTAKGFQVEPVAVRITSVELRRRALRSYKHTLGISIAIIGIMAGWAIWCIARGILAFNNISLLFVVLFTIALISTSMIMHPRMYIDRR